MRFRFFWVISFLISHSFSFAQNKDSLKETIKGLLKEQQLSGAIWAIVPDSGSILTDAYGYKNMQTKELLSPFDKVQVGSISKTILAVGFLRMATLGSISIDDPISKYLPDLPIKNPWKLTNPVTIRQLLDHTSGLTDAKLWHIFSTTALPDTPLEIFYLNSPEILKVQAKPGSIYSYSNIGYTILGMIIEKINNRRYEDFLDDEVLRPLKMVHSSFRYISQASDKLLAYGHFDNGWPVLTMPMYLRSAGQLTTTAGDIGKFICFLLSDGEIGGKTFIDKEYLAAIGKQKFTEAFKIGVPFGDALGAYSRDRYGVVGVAKNGNTVGFTAMLYFFPAEKKGFFIAYNMDSETANFDLFNEIMVKHLGLSVQNVGKNYKTTKNEIADWNGFYIPVVTKVEPFALLDYMFSHTRVETSETGAVLRSVQGKDRTLIYQGNKLFSMEDRTNISHAFYKTPEDQLLITEGVRTIRKVSVLKILAIAVSFLLGFGGLFYLFISGCWRLIKNEFRYKEHAFLGVFISIFILFISVGFLTFQPFMKMGDVTIGNILLAVSTFSLPVFSCIALFLTFKIKKRYLSSINFWAMVCVVQFCLLLILNKMMPLFMWK